MSQEPIKGVDFWLLNTRELQPQEVTTKKVPPFTSDKEGKNLCRGEGS